MSDEHGKFGAYQLLERVGEGGFADVFAARRVSASTADDGAGPVVVKRLHAHLCEQPEMVDMFVTEARVLAELDHPSIVRMYDLERDGVHWAMVMERIAGVDLARLFDQAMADAKPIPLTAAVRLIADVADALHHAHERLERSGDVTLGIIHRDIKPDNLLVTWDGGVKLIDFGCAKATLQSHLTRPGIRKGTLDYMSPEQCLGRPVDRRTDIFSLGVVLYELLTMSRLYADASDARVMERIAHEVARPPSWLDDRVSASLDLVVLRAIEKRPEDRFTTAAEMSRALNWWLDRYAPSDDGHRKMAAWIEANWRQGRSDSGQSAPPELERLHGHPRASGEVVLRRGSPDRGGGIRRSVVSRVVADADNDADAPGRGEIVPEERFATLQELLGRRTNLSPDHAFLLPRPAIVEQVEDAFGSGEQIVVLIGPEGIGKSRIADDVLRRILGSSRRMGGGIWWCGCDDVSDVASLALAIGGVLGTDIPEAAPEAALVLAQTLAARGPTRICLDAIAHLDDDSIELILTLCGAAPELELLLTSRNAPEIARASVISVPPLELPGRLSVMLGSDAATFMIEAVRITRSDFDVDERLRAPLHALLQALKGNPAAMMVAAAQIATGPALDVVLRLLAAHRPTPTRPTALDDDALSAALAWALSQLKGNELKMLATASLFHGGFDLAGASAVWTGLDHTGHPSGVITDSAISPQAVEAVQSLRQRLLISAYEPSEQPGSRRFKLTRSARRFARERLLEHPGADAARHAHASHYLSLAARIVAECDGPESANALRNLRVELPNITAVLHRSLRVDPPTHGSAIRALAAAAALWPYADVAGRYADFGELTERALAHGRGALALTLPDDSATLTTRETARRWAVVAVAASRAFMRRAGPDLGRARALLDEGRIVAVAAESDPAIGLVAAASGEYMLAVGDAAGAAPFLELAAASLAGSGESLVARVGQALVARQLRRLETAEALLVEIVGDKSSAQHETALAIAHFAHGALRVDLDQLEPAGHSLRMALATFERLGDGTRSARVMLELGRLAAAADDVKGAKGLIRDAAEQLRRVGRDDLIVGFRGLFED